MDTRFHRTVLAVSAALLSFPLAAFAWLDPAQPDVATVLNSEDSRFSSVGGPSSQTEWELSYGTSGNSRIKGHQDLMALKFDLSSYRGKTVEQAELHLARSNADSVVSLAVSTINTDWHEGTGSGSRTVGGPCWRWRVTPADSTVFTTDNEWTYLRSDFSTAAFGNFGSLVSYGFAANDTFKAYTVGTQAWIAMKIDPTVAAALILDQYGLTVTDARWHSGASGPNPACYTKDQNSTVQPRLYIKFAATADTTPPGAVTNLAAEAGPENGQVVLRFAAPTDPQAPKALGYTVRYAAGGDFASATSVDRWRIPRPKAPGMAQQVLLENLAAGTTYTFFVQAYDAAGNGGEVASASFAVPAAAATAVLADGTFVTPDPSGKSVQSVPDVMRWWAGSEVVKINPVTGNRMEDGYTSTTPFDDYKKANVVWDAGTNTISLLAARNDIVGAQVFIERLGAALSNVSLTASDLAGPNGSTISAATSVELFQMHYVSSGGTSYAEPAIPLAAPFATTFSVPDPNRNPAGKNQAVWMDIYVPKQAVAGDYTGTLTINAGELTTPVTVNLKIHVSRIQIPDYPTFLVDLNGYSNPWNWGADSGAKDRTTLRYFQVCHKHRMVPNALPYSHLNGVVQSDRVPSTMTGTGSTLHATSWTTFDRRYGPLFDGSAFSPTNPTQPYYGPGANTPITHFYSTFHESWPIYTLDPTYGFDVAGKGPAYWYGLNPGSLVTMFGTLPDVYDAFPDGYKQGLRNVMADWVQHAHDKGWTQTAFETYHNEKYSLTWSGVPDPVFWILEENEAADDFRADGFYHQLWRDGYTQANCPDVKWHFRIDISDRYGLNYGQLDNRINHWNLSSGAAAWHWPQMKYRNYGLDADKQEGWVVYSDSPTGTSSGLGSARAMLRRWAQGMAGLVPFWDAFATSWTGFKDPPGVIYSGQTVPGQSTPYEGAVLSVRAKQMRQAEQVIELLNIWATANGMNRQRVRDSVYAKYGGATWDYSFGSIDETKLYRMKADLLAELEGVVQIPGDINNDGHCDMVDVLAMIDTWGLSAGNAKYNARCDFDGNNTIAIADVLILASYFGKY